MQPELLCFPSILLYFTTSFSRWIVILYTSKKQTEEYNSSTYFVKSQISN